jgi:hypothetical protein
METKDMSPIEIQGDEAGCCYLAYRGRHTVASFDGIDDARRFAASEEVLAFVRSIADDRDDRVSPGVKAEAKAIIDRATGEPQS